MAHGRSLDDERDSAGLSDAAPHYHGHRERLRARFREAGSDAVTDYELLELTAAWSSQPWIADISMT